MDPTPVRAVANHPLWVMRAARTVRHRCGVRTVARTLGHLVTAAARVLDAEPEPDDPTTSGHRHRRIWRGHGRAHLEVRGLAHADGAMHGRLESALRGMRGVDWVSVNAALGRAVIAYDGDAVDFDDIVSAIDEVETAHSVNEERFARHRPEHPGDIEPLRRQLVSLGGDLIGTGIATVLPALDKLSFTRRDLGPADLASVLSIVDSAPRVRRLLERRFGRAATDLTLSLGNAAAQGIAQGPLGLLVDATHRASLINEILARRRVWHRNEPNLHARPAELADPPTPRVVPLPGGPVERYADGTALAGVAAAAATLGFTGEHERALTMLTAGIPKAARLTRESFAAWAGWSLCRHGVVPMDSEALRRLDRVDTVIIDASAVHTGHYSIGQVRGVTTALSEPDEIRLRGVAHSLLDTEHPHRTRHDGGWLLAPLGEVLARTGDTDGPARAAARRVRRPGGVTLGLAHHGRLRAVLSALPDVDPFAAALATAAGRVGTVLVAGASSGAAQDLGLTATISGGSHLPAAIRDLQRQGHVVALVARRGATALRTSDCGIALLDAHTPVPWGAHLLCGADHDDQAGHAEPATPGGGRSGAVGACRVLDATVAARAVSHRGALIAIYGSAVAAVLALTGTGRRARNRSITAVNAAAVLGMAYGVMRGNRLDRRPDPAGTDPTAWHTLDVDTALRRLHAASGGLTEAEASARLVHAPADSTPRRLGLVRATISELANPLTPALVTGSVMSAASGAVIDAALIAGAVTVNAVLGGVERVGADRAVRRLVRDNPVRARVRRDGEVVEINAGHIVDGDVVTLHAGDPVPADCRLLTATNLEVDESGLTGESQAVAKSTSATTATSVAERRSMLYDGTIVAAGEATGLVVATGGRTEVGRSLEGAAPAADTGTGVPQRLRQMTKTSLPVAVGAGATLAGLGLLRGRRVADVLPPAVSLAVASVPEGLPLVATLGASAAARRLSRRGALVRNQSTIEALGRVDVLCFDKTGTLTEGHIHVQRISDGVSETTLDALTPATRQVLAAALRAAPQTDQPETAAHPTDRAVIVAARDAGVDPADCIGGWKVLADLPFESTRGYHAALGACADGELMCVKGAPEAVLPGCTSWRRSDGSHRFDSDALSAVDKRVDHLARHGYRVLAVAQRRAPRSGGLSPDRLASMEFLGLLALADPVRPSAASAVADLRQAGVNVVMVTGDHPSTAESIAAELDIVNGGEVLTGTQLMDLTDEALTHRVNQVSVFARVTPADKVRIVAALSRAGHTVAMAGDGANDAAAIRLADVGVALHGRGTGAAREAADVVVTDDRLETIIDAIVEGRAMWASVRDAVSVLVGGNLGEIGFTLGTGAIARSGSALGPRQLLLVNLFTDLLPSLALAVRPPTVRDPVALLHEGPDKSLGSALTRDTLIRAGATASAATGAWLAARATGTRGRAGTVALASLVNTQLAQTVAAGWRSPLVLGASAISAAGLAAMISTPGVSHFFGCRPLGPIGWSIALGSSALGTAGGLAASAIMAERPRRPDRRR